MFGLAPIVMEGAPTHPDIYINSDELSDEWYKRQLEAYMSKTGDIAAYKHCIRSHLWEDDNG